MKFFAALLISFASLGSAQAAGCFDQHVREAMKINKERLPLYSQLSQGRSEKVSRKLIRLELWTRLLVAGYFDSTSKKYEEMGLPGLFCEDFVSMSDIAEIQKSLSPAISLDEFKPLDTETISWLLKDVLKNRSFQDLSDGAEILIQGLNRQPRFNCMTRHILETIRRSAILAEYFTKKAQSKGLPSPAVPYKSFLKVNIKALKRARNLDVQAAPLQAEGLEILCRDLPYIPKPDLPK